VSFISHALSARGVCYVAAKSYYFGVGGGTSAFTTFCEKFFDLTVDKVETVSDGKSNVREIPPRQEEAEDDLLAL
jgi:hypothetical protein